jgi:hypothetical protein
MKNTISTTTPTLETLNAALTVAVQMADDPNVDRETRASAEAFADAVREEIGRWNPNTPILPNWRGNLDHQRLAHDAMGGM